MQYFFNELSSIKIDQETQVKNVLEKFVLANIKAKEYGYNELRVHESISNLFYLNISDTYNLDNWLNDSSINIDLKDKFRLIFTTSPLLTDNELLQLFQYNNSEFSLNINQSKKIVFGLGAAHLMGSMGVSLATHTAFSNSIVSLEHFSIGFDGDHKIDIVDVLNFDSADVFIEHIPWIEKEKKESVEKITELWLKRIELFPNTKFGSDIERDLQIILNTKKIESIYNTLKKVDEFCKKWKSGGFNLSEFREFTKLDISGESDCTKKRYGTLRKFPCENKVKEQFDLHIKLPDYRIYILPDDSTQNITIGYIGKHLKTCLYD